jgi:hypothetical protein
MYFFGPLCKISRLKQQPVTGQALMKNHIVPRRNWQEFRAAPHGIPIIRLIPLKPTKKAEISFSDANMTTVIHNLSTDSFFEAEA